MNNYSEMLIIVRKTTNKEERGIIRSEKYYCPNCFEKLQEVSGCGSVSYFCNKCKKLISRTSMLKENELEKNKNKNSESQD